MRNENNVTILLVGCPNQTWFVQSSHKPSDRAFPAFQLRIQQVFQASPSLLSLNDREGKISNWDVERLSGRGSLGDFCRSMAFWRRAVESVVGSALFVVASLPPPLFVTTSKNLLFSLFDLRYRNCCMLKTYCNQSYTMLCQVQSQWKLLDAKL
jgi:hypothetical protein